MVELRKRGTTGDYTDKFTVDDSQITEEYIQPQSNRPVKLTPDVQDRFCTAIRRGNSVEVACTKAGIGVRTFYLWCEHGRQQKQGIYRDFIDAVNAAYADVEDDVVNTGLQLALAGDLKAIDWWLKHRRSKQWGEKEKKEEVAKVGGGRIVVIFKESGCKPEEVNVTSQ